MYLGMTNNRTKALFFDIDGTLLSEKTRRVPESAVKALAQARERGHLVFINTGRVYAHLGDIRSQVEADGFLCGCGTCVVAEGRILYHYHIPHERGLAIKRDIDACGLDGALEGMEGGHSGTEIHKGRGNAIREMAGLLTELVRTCDPLVSAWTGGSFSNAIPSKVKVTSAPWKNARRRRGSWAEASKRTPPAEPTRRTPSSSESKLIIRRP